MIPYQGLYFFGILILLLLPVALFGLRGKNLRIPGAVFTALMLLTAFDSPKALVTLAVFWLWQSGLCFGYLALRNRCKQRWALWLFVLASLMPLILVKLSALVPPLRFFSLLGVSYMSFRAVQVLIEVYDGRIKTLNFLDFGYFLTMTLMGLWHGLTPAYLVYGLYHGLLMSANEVLDTKWKGFKKLKKRPVPRAIMTVITFHLFGFGLLIFSGRLF